MSRISMTWIMQVFAKQFVVHRCYKDTTRCEGGVPLRPPLPFVTLRSYIGYVFATVGPNHTQEDLYWINLYMNFRAIPWIYTGQPNTLLFLCFSSNFNLHIWIRQSTNTHSSPNWFMSHVLFGILDSNTNRILIHRTMIRCNAVNFFKPLSASGLECFFDILECLMDMFIEGVRVCSVIEPIN